MGTLMKGPMPSSTPQHGGQSSGQLSDPLSGQRSGPKSASKVAVAKVVPLRPAPVLAPGRADDVIAFYAEFPDRWRAFLHAHFRDYRHVSFFFGVTEKAAQKWWDGIGGVNAGKMAYACATIPTAPQWLYAAE
jgi:hypothetical protein